MTQPSSSAAVSAEGRRATGALVGNRLVLAGALLYLLEWVAIVAAHVDAPVGADASAHDLADAYAGHVQSLGWAAGWFSVVLLGRILIMSGLRTALDSSGRHQPLMSLAVGAMTVSVALEIAVYGLAAGSGWAAAQHPSAGTLRGLDGAAFALNQMLWGPIGVSLLCAGIAMWRAALFPRVLSALALAGGVFATVDGLALSAPEHAGLADAVSSGGALCFWVWMLWLGVLLWRRTPARLTAVAPQPSTVA